MSSVKEEEVSDFRRAIDMLPKSLSGAYKNAVRNAPKVVAIDTPESRFLGTEHGDVSKAAQRMASYWRQRLDIFRDRALLPMNMAGNGEGALNQQDMEVLETASLVHVPKDKSGRSVLVLDLSRLATAHSYPSFDAARLRVGFYVLSLAAENPYSQSEGVVLLTQVSKAPRFDIKHRMVELVADSFPIRTIEMHLIFLPSICAYNKLSAACVDLYQLLLEPLAQTPLIRHGQTDEEVLEDLEKNGFSGGNLPEWIGGSWSMSDFHMWCERRLENEHQRYMTAEELAARRRDVDAARARKKRKEVREESESLHREMEDLQAANKILKAERARLETLWVCACRSVQQSQLLGSILGRR